MNTTVIGKSSVHKPILHTLKTIVGRLFLLSFFSIIATTAMAQQLYRWVDAEGRIHYTDQPPPPNARKTEQKKFSNNTMQTSGLPYAMRKAAENFPVTLYVDVECTSGCVQARAYLNQRGIPFTEKTVKTEADVQAFNTLFQSKSVFLPSVTIGKQRLTGFEATQWSNALDSAGYPPPGSAAARPNTSATDSTASPDNNKKP